MVSSERRLPPELERRIFELSALEHPDTIATLMIVARRVLIWIEPFRYLTLFATPRSRSLAQFMRYAQTSASATLSVRHLFVPASHRPSRPVTFVLASCVSITNVVLMSGSPALLPGLRKQLHLRRFCVNVSRLFDNGEILRNLRHPVFKRVTHLSVLDRIHREPESEILCSIGVLPALTHLCLHSFVHRAQLLCVLAGCTQLEVLVNMHIDTAPEWSLADIGARLAIDDVRFVLVMLDPSFHAYRRDWLKGCRGGSDFWAVAGSFVRRRRAGVIEPAGRCWITQDDHDAIV